MKLQRLYRPTLGFFAVIISINLAQASDLHPFPKEDWMKAFLPLGPKGKGSVSQLETRLQANPGNLDLRIRLLGLTSGGSTPDQREAYDRHVKWFVEFHPENHLFDVGLLRPSEDPSLAAEIRQMWDRHLGRTEAKKIVLAHGANFYILTDSKLTREWFQMGSELEPNEPYWLWRLGFITSKFTLLEWNSQDLDSKTAAKSLGYFEKALALTTSFTDSEKLAHVAAVAFAAGNLEKADLYAHQALEVLRPLEGSDDRVAQMNFIGTRHMANIVIGNVALQRNNMDQAVENLLASTTSFKASKKQAPWWGADLLLAANILDHGRKREVLEYLRMCEKNLRVGSNWFDDWKKAIKKGRADEAALEMREMKLTTRTNSQKRADPPWWEEFYW